MVKKRIFLAAALGIAIALCSCATAAAVATVADQAVADKIKTNAAEPSKQAPSVADSSKSEPAQQSNESNNTINNSPVISPVFNNNPVINNSNVSNTVVNINNAPQGTKVEQSENGVNIQMPEIPQPEAGQAGKGVYVASNSKELKSKVSSYFTKDYGCVLAENAESSAIILNMDYEECEKKNMRDGQFLCKACVEINLQNNKTGKSLYENIVENIEVWTNSMEEACVMTLKPVPNKIWEEIKGKVNKGDCK